MTELAEPAAEYVATPPAPAVVLGKPFDTERARKAVEARVASQRAARSGGDDGISDRMVAKASTAIGSLNPRDMKDSDKLALARAAIDVAGLKRQQATARDLDAEILAVYQAIAETPDVS